MVRRTRLLARCYSRRWLCVVFSSQLIDAKAGEVAQSLGNVVGGAVGALAALAVALWTIKECREADNRQVSTAKELVSANLRNLGSAVLGPIMRIQTENIPNGILQDIFFEQVAHPTLNRHTDPRSPLHLIDVSAVLQLGYLANVVGHYCHA
jgi:hypothetical protein